MTPRDKFARDFAETLTGWRLGILPPRIGSGPELEILRSGIAEILELRLVALCLPLFETMRRMEEQISELERS